MRHSISAQRFGYAIRPVTLADAQFLVGLRNSPHAIGNIGDSAADVKNQEQWLAKYFDRSDDYYFIVESAETRAPVGAVGVYDVVGDTGEWGRWVLTPGIPAAPASTWLAFHVCFDLLGLKTVLGHVVETNRPVITFHERTGFRRVGYSEEPRLIGGKTVRMVAFKADPDDWKVISERLGHFAELASRLG